MVFNPCIISGVCKFDVDIEIEKNPKLCFIAASSSEEFSAETSLIKRVIKESGMKPYLAIEDVKPNTEIFCSKICLQIQISKLCVVLLNPDLKRCQQNHEVRMPNPNVFLEYGMMLSFGKPIVPIMRKEFKIPFDISHLTLGLYSNSNPERVLSKIINTTLETLEEKEKEVYTNQLDMVIKSQIKMIDELKELKKEVIKGKIDIPEIQEKQDQVELKYFGKLTIPSKIELMEAISSNADIIKLLQEGAKHPKEIASRFGISRVAVDKRLKKLKRIGLVEPKPYKSKFSDRTLIKYELSELCRQFLDAY